MSPGPGTMNQRLCLDSGLLLLFCFVYYPSVDSLSPCFSASWFLSFVCLQA